MLTQNGLPTKVFIILISNDRQWGQALQDALGFLANVHMSDNEEQGLRDIRQNLMRHQAYEIIVIDVGTIGGKYSLLVNRIRQEQHEAKVVVASAAPTWRQAKEAFQAGATDYIRKSLDKGELLTVFQEVLKKKPSPWQPNDNVAMVNSEQQ